MKILFVDNPNETFDIFGEVVEGYQGRRLESLKDAHAKLRPLLQSAGVASVSANYCCILIGFVDSFVCRGADGAQISDLPSMDGEMKNFFSYLLIVLFPDWDPEGINGIFVWRLDADTIDVTDLTPPPTDLSDEGDETVG